MKNGIVRFVHITGQEPTTHQPDGRVRLDLVCPFHDGEDPTCWVHFNPAGEGQFVCMPCQRAGRAEHDEVDGKRFVTLTWEGVYLELASPDGVTN